jgi:hypothetical protein
MSVDFMVSYSLVKLGAGVMIFWGLLLIIARLFDKGN